MHRPAARRWADLLAARAIPAAILESAPGDPHRQEPRRFRPLADPPDTPSRRAGLDLLGAGGEVLDVGCGAGAASLALRPTATQVTGLDDATDMLAAFAQACLEEAVPYYAVLGNWPSEAAAAGRADVVVCHHVAYDVADLAPFVLALRAAARRGVVLELTSEHPQAWLDPLWRQFHGVDRPAPPTADDALAVVGEAGLEPSVTRWTSAPSRALLAGPEERARRTCRRLCLPENRAPEVAAALDELAEPPPEKITVSWRTG